MTEETSLQLNKLVESIDGVSGQLELLAENASNPDWWSIGITVVNAAIMIWLGWNQHKLQKRQTEAIDYDTRKRLFVLLNNANTEIDNFLYDLWRHLWEPHYTHNKDFLNKKRKHLDKLKKDLLDSYVDYMLKFPDDAFDKDGYYNILSNMSSLVQQVTSSIEDGTLHLVQGVQEISYIADKEDEAYATAISQCYKTHFDQVVSLHNLSGFIRQKRKVRCDDKFVESIKAKCKID